MLSAIWDILGESAAFILVGFLVAGLLEVFVPAERLTRLLHGGSKRSVFLATMIGAPLPLCSCSVLPTAMTLRKKGAGKGATSAFLISTPETSVSSVLLTYSLLGPAMAIFRPIAACVTAIVAGLSELFFGKPDEGEVPVEEVLEHDHDHCSNDEKPRGPVRRVLRFAFVDLFDDLFAWMLIGVVAAAIIRVAVPDEVLMAVMGGPWQQKLLMVAIGIPLYVCAEASTPIAAALIARGLSPGAALVLLLTGPATNAGTIGLLARSMGRRSILIYLGSIIFVGLGMGWLLDVILSRNGFSLVGRVLEEPLVPAWIKHGGAVAFLLLGIGTARRLRWIPRLAEQLDESLPLRVTPGRLRFVAVLGAVALWLCTSLVALAPGEVGVFQRLGAVHAKQDTPGLHLKWPWPLEQVHRVRPERLERTILGVSAADAQTTWLGGDPSTWNLIGDENIADLEAVVHWRAEQGKEVEFAFALEDPQAVVSAAGYSALQEVLASRTITAILTGGRQPVEAEVLALARERIRGYDSGIEVVRVQLLDAHAPPEVHVAFRDVASALEDSFTQVDQARAEEARLIPIARAQAASSVSEAKGYAQSTLLRAKGEADAFVALLSAYRESPEVTRARLELEALERVLPGVAKYIRPGKDSGTDVDIWFTGGASASDLPAWGEDR